VGLLGDFILIIGVNINLLIKPLQIKSKVAYTERNQDAVLKGTGLKSKEIVMNVLNTIMNSTLDSLSHSFNLLWSKVSPILLPLLLVLVFSGIGLWLAGFISDKIGALIKKIRVDSLLDKVLAPTLKITGTKINASSVIINSVRWFLVALILIAALDLANLDNVTDFISQIISYLPNVLVAALILIAGSMLGNLAHTIAGFVSKNGFSTTAKVAVNALAFIAAIGQLVTPIVGSLNQAIGQLSLSKMQADVLVIGLIVLALFASKNAIAKTVENFLQKS